jgi:two-component system OmpR family response regulator
MVTGPALGTGWQDGPAMNELKRRKVSCGCQTPAFLSPTATAAAHDMLCYVVPSAAGVGSGCNRGIMERPDHILIVDDDAEIRTLLGRYLEKNGLRATTVADGRAMWQAIDRGAFDLVVLDVMLPGDDGLTLCRTLRARSDIPIIMLTARGEETDRIVGLEMGADDYVPKPFSARELLARIKVILRRTRSLPRNLQPEEDLSIRFGGWTLDNVHRHLVSPAGVVTPIGGAEYKLLRIFLGHANRVLSRDQLMEMTQGREADALDRSIDVQVSRLRRRLGDGTGDVAMIRTVRGEGYVLSVPVDKEGAS